MSLSLELGYGEVAIGVLTFFGIGTAGLLISGGVMMLCYYTKILITRIYSDCVVNGWLGLSDQLETTVRITKIFIECISLLFQFAIWIYVSIVFLKMTVYSGTMLYIILSMLLIVASNITYVYVVKYMGIFQNTISPVIGKGNVITHDGGLTYEVVSDFGTNYYWTIKKTASGDEIQTRYSIEQLNTLPVRILTVINSKKVSVKSEQNLIFQKKTF